MVKLVVLILLVFYRFLGMNLNIDELLVGVLTQIKLREEKRQDRALPSASSYYTKHRKVLD